MQFIRVIHVNNLTGYTNDVIMVLQEKERVVLLLVLPLWVKVEDGTTAKSALTD